MKLNRPKYRNFEPGHFPTEADGFDLVELKYDGWWGQLVLDRYMWELYSRTGQLKKHGQLSTHYARTIIHGEYCVGTEWATEHPEYYGRLAAFDLAAMGGESTEAWSTRTRREMLLGLLAQLAEEEILGGLYAVPRYPIAEAPQLWAYNEEFEGLVFKTARAPWGAPFGRMKRAVEMDYICVGFEESRQGRFLHNGVASVLGGLIPAGSEEPVQVCRVSGLTDEQRREFYRNPNAYMWRVFTARGKRVTAKGALRHPDFVRWRDDKPAQECTWEKGK